MDKLSLLNGICKFKEVFLLKSVLLGYRVYNLMNISIYANISHKNKENIRMSLLSG